MIFIGDKIERNRCLDLMRAVCTVLLMIVNRQGKILDETRDEQAIKPPPFFKAGMKLVGIG